MTIISRFGEKKKHFMGSLLHFLRPEMAIGDTDFVYREAREYSCGAWGDRQGGGQSTHGTAFWRWGSNKKKLQWKATMGEVLRGQHVKKFQWVGPGLPQTSARDWKEWNSCTLFLADRSDFYMSVCIHSSQESIDDVSRNSCTVMAPGDLWVPGANVLEIHWFYDLHWSTHCFLSILNC